MEKEKPVSKRQSSLIKVGTSFSQQLMARKRTTIWIVLSQFPRPQKSPFSTEGLGNGTSGMAAIFSLRETRERSMLTGGSKEGNLWSFYQEQFPRILYNFLQFFGWA